MSEGEDQAAKPADAPTVFVSDPSVEAERVSQALREAGLRVVDVPLSMLVARVAVQRPRVVILDADAEGALDAVARMRELPNSESIDVIFCGRAGAALSTAEDALAHEGSGFFPRPVQVPSLVKKIQTLLTGDAPEEEAGWEAPPEARAEEAPATSEPTSTRRSDPPPAPVSVRPPSVPPPVSQEPASMAVQGPLSPELSELLAQAEARVSAQKLPSDAPTAPSPEEELDAVLPEEVLSALDEPIEDDDDDEELEGSAPGTTSGGSATTGRRSQLPPPPAEALTSDGIAHPKTQGEPASPTTSAAATGVATRGDMSAGSRPDPSFAPGSPPAFGVSTSTSPTTPPRRPPSSVPPPIYAGVPPSILSSTLGSELLVQAGGMLLPPQSLQGLPQPPVASPPQPPQQPPPAESPPSMPEASLRAESVPVPVIAPQVLGAGDAARVLAQAVATRQSGALTFETMQGVRRIVLREGDVVTAASGVDGESLLTFLGARGDLPRERVEQLAGRMPPYGRHAGAALVAQGVLGQDQLWPVLRAHAEWLMGHVIGIDRGTSMLDPEPPGRLKSEPSVFGGSAGAEVFVEVVRRTIGTEYALAGVGGRASQVAPGAREALLSECGLGPAELDAIERSRGQRVDAVVAAYPETDIASVLYGLFLLGVVDIVRSVLERRPGGRPERAPDALDEDAVRDRIRARLELVEEGDYFAVLGVPRNATGYEVRRAYVDLRRAFEPSRLLTPHLADLADDVRKIIAVLEEAYEILGDGARRDRYRRAIEQMPERA